LEAKKGQRERKKEKGFAEDISARKKGHEKLIKRGKGPKDPSRKKQIGLKGRAT